MVFGRCLGGVWVVFLGFLGGIWKALKWLQYVVGFSSEWYRNGIGMTSVCFWGVFGVVLGVVFGCGFFLCVWGCFCGVCGVFACLFIFLVKGVSSPLQHAT